MKASSHLIHSDCRSGTRSFSEITPSSWSVAFYSRTEWALQLSDSQRVQNADTWEALIYSRQSCRWKKTVQSVLWVIRIGDATQTLYPNSFRERSLLNLSPRKAIACFDVSLRWKSVLLSHSAEIVLSIKYGKSKEIKCSICWAQYDEGYVENSGNMLWI